FRAKDGQTYLLVRANALENNFRLYTIVNGKRSTIASARVTEPKLGVWHTIRVVAAGPKIQAYLDGTMLLNHQTRHSRMGGSACGRRLILSRSFLTLRSQERSRTERTTSARGIANVLVRNS